MGERLNRYLASEPCGIKAALHSSESDLRPREEMPESLRTVSLLSQPRGIMDSASEGSIQHARVWRPKRIQHEPCFTRPLSRQLVDTATDLKVESRAVSGGNPRSGSKKAPRQPCRAQIGRRDLQQTSFAPRIAPEPSSESQLSSRFASGSDQGYSPPRRISEPQGSAHIPVVPLTEVALIEANARLSRAINSVMGRQTPHRQRRSETQLEVLRLGTPTAQSGGKQSPTNVLAGTPSQWPVQISPPPEDVTDLEIGDQKLKSEEYPDDEESLDCRKHGELLHLIGVREQRFLL